MVSRCLVAAVACACSGSESKGTVDARPSYDARDPTVLWVAGQYPTAVTLLDSTCTGITVQNMPTEVVHSAGAGEVALVHATIRHDGTVQRDGTFATGPRGVDVGGGERHTLTIAGRFTVSGFDATVTAAVTRSGTAECGYSVGWVGAKSGEPNVIPE